MIEVDGIERAVELAAWLRTENLPGVVDLVPAATTVLVQVDAPPVLALVEERVARHQPVGLDAVLGELVEIPTVYDGEDVADVARQSGLDLPRGRRAPQLDLLRRCLLWVDPGFAYLTGLDRACNRRGAPAREPECPPAPLHVARLSSRRCIRGHRREAGTSSAVPTR